MQRRLALHALGWAALVAMLPSTGGCSATASGRHWQSVLLREHPLTGKIWDVGAQRFITRESLAESLRRAYFRLLGEVHDNPDHHLIQAELLNVIGSAGLRPMVAFEQFDREYDAALHLLQAAAIPSADDVAVAVKFDRRGWTWEFYRPLIEMALRYGMPLRAANLSRAAAGQIVKEFTVPGRRQNATDAPWSAEKEHALRAVIVEGHCGALPDSVVPAMTAAQRARDTSLAEVLLEAGSDGAVLLTGNGHVRRDIAVPVYLRAAASARSICAIGILEVEAGSNEPQSYAMSGAGVPPFDFVCFTPRRERPDPCATFKSG
ncbi:MAG: ChaN family lipoprotein [Burkholderiales bacterium]